MKNPEVRIPAVAGQFYESSAEGLKKQIGALVDTKKQRRDVIGCVLPHAGYVYSGKVAGETVSCINIKDRVILVGPNHTGFGTEFSIMAKGTWRTPLGDVKIDPTLAGAILKNFKFAKEDKLAHLYEHSLEVELPFLQYFGSDFEIVPIAIMSQDLSKLKELGRAIAKAIEESVKKDCVMIVASSDMTHYESEEQAKKKDNEAIKAILELDEDKLMERVNKFDISMCGVAPVAAMLTAAKSLGAREAALIKYQTSGDVTQDKKSVVGYAGITVY